MRWTASQSDQNLRGPRVSCAADVAHRPPLHGFAARRMRCPGTDRRPDDEQTDTIPFKNTYTIKKIQARQYELALTVALVKHVFATLIIRSRHEIVKYAVCMS